MLDRENEIYIKERTFAFLHIKRRFINNNRQKSIIKGACIVSDIHISLNIRV